MAEMKVTPWEVTGEVDYDKLRRDFGLDRIDQPLLDRMKKHTGELHYLLRRGIFYAHRDLGWLLDEYEKGNKFFLYTGRGPSGHTHLGHLIPWTFTKWLQDKFKTELWFQITDDEKFLFKDGMSLEESHSYAIENALDIIALGFDPKRTKIFIDTDYSKTMYPHAVRVAKHITFSTAKAVFGFTNETNIGSIFYTSMQAVPAFLPSVMAKKNIPCLIPLAVDQDPHFRVARDVMPKLGYYKPAIMHSKFMPGLGPGGKMSASDPNSTIYTTDTPDVVKAKVQRAFTGQQPTRELQKKLGGNPDICSICQFYRFFFEQDDKKLEKIFESERDGSLMAGEHKADLTERANKFLAEHQKKREKARSQLDKFLLRD
jgi:tryptophanyl-tRNA synthetase